MGNVVYHTQCPSCASQGRDNSCDNLAVYDDDSYHCFSCGYTKVSEDWIKEYGNSIKNKGDVLISNKDLEKFQEKSLSEDELKFIQETTVSRLNVKYRGLDNDVCEDIGIRWKVDEAGKPLEMYFPAKVKSDGEDKITGYKIRKLPKDFYSRGYVGKVNGFFGQTKTVAETLIIVAGEVDLITAIQSLKAVDKYHKSYNVVTSPLGEDSTSEIIKLNYDWVDSHSKIIVALDNDTAGEVAFEKVKAVVSNDKLFKANLRHKDLNDYLKNGDAEKLAQDLYWNATPVKNFGLIGSSSLLDKALEVVKLERIPLPPFLNGLDETFSGGIALQEIVNIVSSVSTGKSVFVNEIVLHWIVNSPYKMLIVSLEDNAGSYGAKIASRIIGNKIMALRTIEERTKALQDNREEIEKYLVDENGDNRFILMEDATSDLETMKKAILQAIRAYGCKVILIDPLQSLIGSKPLEEQVKWMEFEEETRRIYGVTYINIAHTRKTGSGEQAHSEGGLISEEQIKGSQQIAATATTNIILRRNKVAEDEIERNTTYVDVVKNRTVGITGRNIAKIYYSNEHHTLFDFDYAQKNNFFKGLSFEEFKSVADMSKASAVVSSLDDEDVDEAF